MQSTVPKTTRKISWNKVSEGKPTICGRFLCKTGRQVRILYFDCVNPPYYQWLWVSKNIYVDPPEYWRYLKEEK